MLVLSAWLICCAVLSMPSWVPEVAAQPFPPGGASAVMRYVCDDGFSNVTRVCRTPLIGAVTSSLIESVVPFAELSTLRWYAIPDRESMYAQSVLCTTGEPAVPSPIVLVLSST